MKKLIFLSLVALIGNMSVASAQGSGSNCLVLSNPMVEACNNKPGWWNISVHFMNPDKNHKKSIKFSCDGNSTCKSECVEVSGQEGNAKATIQCPNISKIKITGYSSTDCKPGCDCPTIALPVVLKTFSALRHDSDVSLTWETALEQNSRGFSIEVNSDGIWKQIAFIASKAGNGGNSDISLSYDYKDITPPKGISQYRLIQQDIDGKKSYSSIRMVRAATPTGRTQIVPNPSNGIFTIVFDDNNLHDVVVYDITGRIFRQEYAVKNSMFISDLHRGIFLLKVSSPGVTEDFRTEKIIVQ